MATAPCCSRPSRGHHSVPVKKFRPLTTSRSELELGPCTRSNLGHICRRGCSKRVESRPVSMVKAGINNARFFGGAWSSGNCDWHRCQWKAYKQHDAVQVDESMTATAQRVHRKVVPRLAQQLSALLYQRHALRHCLPHMTLCSCHCESTGLVTLLAVLYQRSKRLRNPEYDTFNHCVELHLVAE